MDFADSIERTDELEVWKYETLTYSFKEIPDSILEGLKWCAEKRKYKYKICLLLFNKKVKEDNGKTIAEQVNYFKVLFSRAAKIMEEKYTDQELTIFAYYMTRLPPRLAQTDIKNLIYEYQQLTKEKVHSEVGIYYQEEMVVSLLRFCTFFEENFENGVVEELIKKVEGFRDVHSGFNWKLEVTG